MTVDLTNKPKIKYIHGDQTMLDRVKDIWGELNRYNCKRSKHFKEHYLQMTWQKRKEVLLKKVTGGEIHVELAIDESSMRSIGYVISSINTEKTGEIESVYVENAFRRMGVGDTLMKNALKWMDDKGTISKQVEVSVGNEVAWKFYKRFGFLPRKTILKQASG